jgi:succinylarginine dihydrolase
MDAREVNFDGLIGPTHNYAGLGPGNLASQRNRAKASNPRAAALQGLAKMRLLHDLGVPQAVLPPQDRPCLSMLRRAGFDGDDAAVLIAAKREAPGLLAAAWSASSMWAANAATVCPSVDAGDGRVHFTPANLVSSLHRSLEAEQTARSLRAIFADGSRFAHHPPLPAADDFRDEGAANHTRLAADFDTPGLHLFVHGDESDSGSAKRRFRSRQAAQASACIARLHRLDPQRYVLLKQSPAAIDAGVFHNDVIAVGHRNLLLVHQDAFADEADAIDRLKRAYEGLVHGVPLRLARVTRDELSLDAAVRSYLFNSQVVDAADGRRLLIAPNETRDNPASSSVVRRLVSEGALDDAVFVDVRQSMSNGGGPACLRLRVVLTAEERRAIAPGVWFDADRHDQLAAWVERHYRDRLTPDDLADPRLADESRAALDELTRLLGLGSIYPFQRLAMSGT